MAIYEILKEQNLATSIPFENYHLDPSELIRGEVYVNENEIYGPRVFRFNKLRSCNRIDIYSQFVISAEKGYEATKGYVPFGTFRHATPKEKRLLLKFEETLYDSY